MGKSADNVAALNALPTNLAAKVGDTGDETIAGVKTFSSSPVVPTPTTASQAATKASVDLAKYPALTPQSGNYTLALTDLASGVKCTNSGAQTIFIPANATVAFPQMGLITIVNEGTTPVTIDAATAGVTLKLAGLGSTGNRTLAVTGLCTLAKVDTNTWYISGAGVS